jgi:hypothetical protein
LIIPEGVSLARVVVAVFDIYLHGSIARHSVQSEPQHWFIANTRQSAAGLPVA